MREPIPIAAADDPIVSRYRLRDRQLAPILPDPSAPDGLFVAEGDLVIERALAGGYRIDSVLADDRPRFTVLDHLDPDVPVFLGGAAVRAALTGYGVQLDIIALFHRRPLLDAATIRATARRVAVVEAVDNPANLGGIVRSAVALGIDGMIVEAKGADPYARRCVRASMGTSLQLPTARVANVGDEIQAMLADGFAVFALTPDPDAASLDDVRADSHDRAAIVLGSERAGLSPQVLSSGARPVRIPMAAGVDSLNVAAAAAVAFYTLR